MGQRAICLSLNLGRRCMRAYPSCLRMIHHTLPLPEALCQLYNKPNNFPCIDRVPSVSNSFSSSIYRQMGNGVSSDRGTYPAALGEVVLLGNLCCRRAIASWGNSLKLRFARQTQTRRGGWIGRSGSAEGGVCDQLPLRHLFTPRPSSFPPAFTDGRSQLDRPTLPEPISEFLALNLLSF